MEPNTAERITAAAVTVQVVEQVERTRGLGRAEAVAVVARATGSTIESVEDLVDLGVAVIAAGAELLGQR